MSKLDQLLDDIKTDLSARGYSSSVIEAVLMALKRLGSRDAIEAELNV